MTTEEQDKIDELEKESKRDKERIFELMAQVHALTGELQRYQAKHPRRTPPVVFGVRGGINLPNHYFEAYKYHSKEAVLLALMNAESLLFRYAIIQKASTPSAPA